MPTTGLRRRGSIAVLGVSDRAAISPRSPSAPRAKERLLGREYRADYVKGQETALNTILDRIN
jgi:hypothetical protein